MNLEKKLLLLIPTKKQNTTPNQNMFTDLRYREQRKKGFPRCVPWTPMFLNKILTPFWRSWQYYYTICFCHGSFELKSWLIGGLLSTSLSDKSYTDCELYPASSGWNEFALLKIGCCPILIIDNNNGLHLHMWLKFIEHLLYNISFWSSLQPCESSK